MKWRLVDRVRRFEPWASIEGHKCVSLEEYSLLKRFGRKGILPSTLVLECCVDLARWLVMCSSGWTHGAVLVEVSDVAFEREVGMSDVLELSVKGSLASDTAWEAGCEVTTQGNRVMHGSFTVELVELSALLDPDDVRALWKEIHGAA